MITNRVRMSISAERQPSVVSKRGDCSRISVRLAAMLTGVITLAAILCAAGTKTEQSPIRTLATLSGHQATVVSLAWSPNGQMLVSASDWNNSVYMWDVQAAKRVPSSSSKTITGSVQAVQWTHEGALLATTEAEGHAIAVWKVATGERIATLRGHTDVVRSLSWSANSKRLASCSIEDYSTRVWDRFTGKQLCEIYPDARAIVVGLSPDAKQLAVGHKRADVSLWTIKGCGFKRTIQMMSDGVDFSVDTRPMAWSRDAKFLATTGPFTPIEQVFVWNVSSGKRIFMLAQEKKASMVTSMSWSPNGERLAVGNDLGVFLWEMKSGECVEKIDTDTDTTSLAWSPNGRRLAGGLIDGRILIWDVGQVGANNKPDS
jgi:WD40 repeat protein